VVPENHFCKIFVSKIDNLSSSSPESFQGVGCNLFQRAGDTPANSPVGRIRPVADRTGSSRGEPATTDTIQPMTHLRIMIR
jgi:hypothetical protein